MAELAKRSGLSVATIKFYLREGLLPPGQRSNVNQAEYDEAHLERLRMIRALAKVARLPLAPDARAEAESSVIGGIRAVAAAPPELQPALGHTVQQAFVSAMQSANLVAAGVGAVACVVVAVFLRTRPASRHRRTAEGEQVSVRELLARAGKP